MADPRHLERIAQGELAWNQWRREHPNVAPDLRSAELQGRELGGFDFSGADLSQAALMGAQLRHASFVDATLDRVKINDARAPYADFTRAKLPCAYLWGSDFRETKFSQANLRGADLRCAQLVKTDFQNADLTGCRVYGISAWDVKLEGAQQEQLSVAPPNTGNAWNVTVGDLHVAQFIYLLTSQDKLRAVLTAVSDRGVLILGRFGGGGIELLRAVAASLRDLEYLPIIFDFPPQEDRTVTETVQTLAGLSRFVIVDLSGPSVPQELYATVPHLKIPFVPILQEGRHPWSMFRDLLEYPWVLKPPVEFADEESLIKMLPRKIVAPAEQRVQERLSRLRTLD